MSDATLAESNSVQWFRMKLLAALRVLNVRGSPELLAITFFTLSTLATTYNLMLIRPHSIQFDSIANKKGRKGTRLSAGITVPSPATVTFYYEKLWIQTSYVSRPPLSRSSILANFRKPYRRIIHSVPQPIW